MDTYTITTKDGITITGIPKDVPNDAPELKARVASIRSSRKGGEPVSEVYQSAPAPVGPLAPAPVGPPAPTTAEPVAANAPTMANVRRVDQFTPPLMADSGKTTPAGLLGAAVRGSSPVAAGTALGAAAGAPFAGVGAIPGAAAGGGITAATFAVGDMGIPIINKILGTHYQTPTEAWGHLLTSLGVPEPDTAAERIVEAASRGAAGGVGDVGMGTALAKSGNQAVQGIGRAMAAGPAGQVAGGAGAAAAAQGAGEAGAGPLVQMGAGLAGGILGSRLAPGGVELMRPQAPKAQTAVEAGTEIGALVKKASSARPGRAAARKMLAALADVNPEAKAAADRLGFELPADVFADNPQVRAAAGLARSVGGSEIESAWKASVSNALDRADDVLKQYDTTFIEGTAAPAVVSDRVRDALTKTRSALHAEATTLYDEIDKAMPKQTPVKLDNLEALLKTLSNEVGTAGMSSQEKTLLKMLDQEPTYGRLLREKNLIAQAMDRKASPYGNMEAGSLKRLYGALAEDQLANIDAKSVKSKGGFGEEFFPNDKVKRAEFETQARKVRDQQGKGEVYLESLNRLAADFNVDRSKLPAILDDLDAEDALYTGPNAIEFKRRAQELLKLEGQGEVYVQASEKLAKDFGMDYYALQSIMDEDLNKVIRINLGEKLRSANLIYAKERDLGERIVEVFGSDVEGSIANKMRSSIVSAGKGNAESFNKLLELVPEDLRRETVATSLASVARNRKGEFGFAEYAQTYKNLRANPPVYAKIVQTLGEGSDQVLRDLYAVSKRITDARANVLTMGKPNQALIKGMAAESLIGKVLHATVRIGATMIGAKVAGPIGAGVGSVVTDALSGGSPNGLQKAGRMFNSPQFQNLVVSAAAGQLPGLDQIRAVARSSTFDQFARAVKLPIATDQRELWILAALQSGAGVEEEEQK